LGKEGTINNDYDITNAKKRFNTSKRIGKQVKKLTAVAKKYEPKNPSQVEAQSNREMYISCSGKHP
jgi:hypothetical protein